jgi:hypothetical protein
LFLPCYPAGDEAIPAQRCLVVRIGWLMLAAARFGNRWQSSIFVASGALPRCSSPCTDGWYHVPRHRRWTTNWTEHDAARRQRGSLTAWLTEDAITTATLLTLQRVFRLTPRQANRVISSVVRLPGLDLAILTVPR